MAPLITYRALTSFHFLMSHLSRIDVILILGQSYLACVDIEVVVPVLAEEVGEDLRRPDLAVAADELDDLLAVVCHEGNRAQHVADVAASHTMKDKMNQG